MSGRPVADIYIRESKDDLVKGYSPAEMVRQCRAKAAELGVDVDRVVIEEAKRDEWDSPEFNEEIRRAKAGLIAYLISYDMSRLSGELARHLVLRSDLQGTGCRIAYVSMQVEDTIEGELTETIFGGLGRFERMQTRRRTQNGIAGKLADGEVVCNGRAPYGLDKVYRGSRPVGYCPNARLDVLRRIIRELRTATAADVCTLLNGEGVPSPDGGRWEPGSVLSLVNNPIYAGRYRFGVTKQTPARGPDGRRTWRKEKHAPETVRGFAIEPFVDLGELAAARAAMAERTKVRRPRRAPDDDPFTLRGLLRCGYCSGVLSCTVNNGYRRYTCLRAYPPKGTQRRDDERCRLPQVHADDLERHAWAELSRRLEDRTALEDALRLAADGGDAVRRWSERRAALGAEIARLEQRLANVAEQMPDYAVGTEMYASLKERALKTEDTLTHARAGLAELDRQAPSVLGAEAADGIRALWDDLRLGIEEAGDDAAKQRLAFRAFEVRCTVRLDPGGVRLGRAHAYAFEWGGHVDLSGSEKYPHGYFSLWNSQPGRSAFAWAASA